MKKTLATCTFIASALGAFATATVTDANGILTIAVPSGEDYNLSTHASGIAANTWTEIVKTGLGTLNGAGAFTSAFRGTLRISEGYYYATSRDSLPNNTSAKVVVEGNATGGGTLKTHVTTSGFKWDSNAHLYLSGTGVGGTAGAIHNLSTQSTEFHWVQLDADILWHNNVQAGQSQLRTHFDMQGHNATFTGPGETTFFVAITNPGDLYENGRVIRFNSSQIHGLNGEGRPHRIYVLGGNVSAYNTNNMLTDWEIFGDHPSGQGLLSILASSGNTSSTKTNKWTGSIYLESGAVTNTIHGGDLATPVYFRICERGRIAGPGTAFYYQGQTWVHGTNTYEGGTIVNADTQVHFVDEKSIPRHDGYGDISVFRRGVAAFAGKSATNPIGWGAQAWFDISRSLSRTYDEGWNCFAMEVPEGQTAELGTGEIGGTGSTGRPYTRLSLMGGGTAMATATFADKPWFCVFATNQMTTLELSTPNAAGGAPGWMQVKGRARLVFKDAGLLTCTTNIQIFGNANIGENPRLIVDAQSRIVRPEANKGAGFELGMAGGGRPNGTLEIRAGGVVSNRLQSANSNDSTGTLLVRSGGIFRQMGASGEDTYSAQGARSEAYYELEDGATMSARGTGIYTSGGSSGISLFSIKGGLWDHSGGSLSVGRESTGMVYQTGGTIRMGTQFAAFPSANYRRANNMNKSGFGSLTLEGARTEFVSSTRVGLCDRGYSRGQIDVNDGASLTALKISKSLVQFWKSNSSTNQYSRPVQTTAYVGFNGGTLRAAGNATDWLGNPSETFKYGDTGLTETGVGDSRPDYVTVYAGGATLDASNFNVTVQAPIVKPGTGKSVTALAIPANADMTGYTAAPIVQIFGDGQGALAMALYDSTNGVVTGVKVVSPGWGYTTATAQLIRGGKSTATALEVTLADADTTGGLTVTGGTGTVTLEAANTYGGPTTTAGGTLKVAHANAIPDGSEIRLGDGVLDMNGFAIPSSSTVKIADPSAYVSRSNTVTVARNLTAPVTVANVNEMPPNWYVDQSGGSLYLIFSRGTYIIFR